MNMSNEIIVWSHCNSCSRKTKHVILATKESEDTDEIESVGLVTWWDRYDMLQCQGCESVKLKHSSSFSENPDVSVSYFPPDVSRPLPRWQSKLPHTLRSMLSEIYTALHADGRRLAMMGAPTVLDMVLLDKIGDVGTFSEKLKALERDGFIGQKQREYLAAALDVGSAAAHRGHNPNSAQVNEVMDIIENLLEGIYVLARAADELKKTTPARGTEKQKAP